MEIEIKIPDLKITEEEQLSRNKALLSNDKQNGLGYLSLIIPFLKIHGPLSVTDLKDLIQSYLKREVERVNVYRQADRLFKLGILHKVSSGDILTMEEYEKETIHKHIEAKHRKFLSTISLPFRKTYGNRNYFWLSNGEGDKYVEWCCKLNGFEYKKK